MPDTYEVTEEFLLEVISYLKQMHGNDVVEELCKIRDDEENIITKKFLQKEIDHQAIKLKICKNCFSELEPIIKKEYHGELDNNPYETFVDGYKCPSCDRKYNY